MWVPGLRTMWLPGFSGSGDATVAGGLSLVHTYPPYGALVQSRISGPGRARARPWLELDFGRVISLSCPDLT